MATQVTGRRTGAAAVFRHDARGAHDIRSLDRAPTRARRSSLRPYGSGGPRRPDRPESAWTRPGRPARPPPLAELRTRLRARELAASQTLRQAQALDAPRLHPLSQCGPLFRRERLHPLSHGGPALRRTCLNPLPHRGPLLRRKRLHSLPNHLTANGAGQRAPQQRAERPRGLLRFHGAARAEQRPDEDEYLGECPHVRRSEDVLLPRAPCRM